MTTIVALLGRRKKPRGSRFTQSQPALTKPSQSPFCVIAFNTNWIYIIDNVTGGPVGLFLRLNVGRLTGMDGKFAGYGFGGIEDVTRLGYGVEENAAILHRFAWVERQLIHISAGWMISVPEWEAKILLARHLYEDAEHHDVLRTRISELRRAERSVDKAPDPALGALMDELIRARNSRELLVGIYEVVKPALVGAYRAHLDKINPLVDYNTGRMLKLILLEEEEHAAFGQAFVKTLLETDEQQAEAAAWAEHLRAYLAAAGGMNGEAERLAAEKLPAPRSDGGDFKLPLDSKRDERFKVSIPKNPTTFVPEYGDRTREGLEQMMWVRFHEMSPAETVGAILYLEAERPWKFLYDLARHTWDEVRHSAFGQAALEAEGFDVTRNPNWTGFAEMCLAELDPIEAYTHLTVAVEQAAMKYPPGKRQEYEFCRDTARHALMALYQDYDWADEVNHSQFGQEWIIKAEHHGDRQAAIAAGQQTVERRAKYFEQFLQAGEELDGISKKARGGGPAIGY